MLYISDGRRKTSGRRYLGEKSERKCNRRLSEEYRRNMRFSRWLSEEEPNRKKIYFSDVDVLKQLYVTFLESNRKRTNSGCCGWLRRRTCTRPETIVIKTSYSNSKTFHFLIPFLAIAKPLGSVFSVAESSYIWTLNKLISNDDLCRRRKLVKCWNFH